LVTVVAPSTEKLSAEPSIVAAAALWGAWIATARRPSAATVLLMKDDTAIDMKLPPPLCRATYSVVEQTGFCW
jgi:hypothetical protein